MLPIAEKIFNSMQSDCESYEKVDCQIDIILKSATDTEFIAINDFCIALCGWSIRSLQEMKK